VSSKFNTILQDIWGTLGGHMSMQHKDKHYFLPFSTVLKPNYFLLSTQSLYVSPKMSSESNAISQDIWGALGGHISMQHKDKHYSLPFSTVLKPNYFFVVHPELICFTQNV
jgi:isoprenylcysteine carboxyl methyltransferase (ICMT) family protein YpbQ